MPTKYSQNNQRTVCPRNIPLGERATIAQGAAEAAIEGLFIFEFAEGDGMMELASYILKAG